MSRIREHIGSVIGGRVPATQGSSGPCVYCRKPGVRSLYTYVASYVDWEKLYTQSKELGPMQRKSHHRNYTKSLYMSGLWYMSPRRNWDTPNPCPASECALPPGPKGEGHTRLLVRG
jgi:hypothetical protein